MKTKKTSIFKKYRDRLDSLFFRFTNLDYDAFALAFRMR